MRNFLSLLLLLSGLQLVSAQSKDANNLTVPTTPNSVLTNSHIKTGKVIDNFNFKDLNGKSYSLASLKGKVVVLNFWFASCKPCIDEVDELNFLVNKYKDSNVVFLSPSFETMDVCKRFVEKYQFKTNVCNDQKEFTKTLELIYYPTNIILDKDGFIYKAYSGSVPDIDKVLSAELDFLLRM